MSFSKLKKLHIIIIGSILIIGSIAAIYFLMVKPQNEAFQAAFARFQANDPGGSPQERAKAVQDREKALQEKSMAQSNLNAQMEQRMPKLNFTNRETAMIALWHEQIEKLGPTLEQFAKAPQKNVRVTSASFMIPPPPVNPNDAVFTQDLLTFNLGTVQATGDFKSLLNNMRRWNSCNRLVMVGPPVISGTSPKLTIQYSVMCYVYPMAVASANSTIQIAGGAAAAGAPGGAGAPGATPMAPAAMPMPGAAGPGSPP